MIIRAKGITIDTSKEVVQIEDIKDFEIETLANAKKMSVSMGVSTTTVTFALDYGSINHPVRKLSDEEVEQLEKSRAGSNLRDAEEDDSEIKFGRSEEYFLKVLMWCFVVGSGIFSAYVIWKNSPYGK